MKRKLQFLSLLAVSLFYGQQVTIGSGTAVDSNRGLSTPIAIFYGYSLTQQIYLASEIGGAMTIQELKFYLNNPVTSLSNTGQLDVWIGHTSVGFQNTISSTGAGWLPVSQQQQVLTSGEATYSGNEITVTLATPFVYNGTDNIVITFDENKAGNNGNSFVFYQTVDFPNDVTMLNRSDTVDPSPANPPLNYTGPNSTTSTTEVQSKKHKAIITLIGQNLGVSEVRTVGDVVLSPNPTTDFISFKSKMEISSVEIFDIGGRLINSQALKDDKIDVRNFSAGVYTLKINYKNGLSTTKKIIKK
ncbi:T9SS type A sorting domain-containing protein [Chryseobacterium terrae]|uniref:T9SS type A sorting domain-containing protein n=1 Tax=Chryseobacterium terrae TaxID=3163299 RepID=A0ABW8Y118_9FLAO